MRTVAAGPDRLAATTVQMPARWAGSNGKSSEQTFWESRALHQPAAWEETRMLGNGPVPCADTHADVNGNRGRNNDIEWILGGIWCPDLILCGRPASEHCQARRLRPSDDANRSRRIRTGALSVALIRFAASACSGGQCQQAAGHYASQATSHTTTVGDGNGNA